MKKIFLLLISLLLISGCTKSDKSLLLNAEQANIKMITSSMDAKFEDSTIDNMHIISYLYPSSWPSDLMFENVKEYKGQGYLYMETITYKDDNLVSIKITINNYNQDELYKYIQELLDEGYEGENDIHTSFISDCILVKNNLKYAITEKVMDTDPFVEIEVIDLSK